MIVLDENITNDPFVEAVSAWYAGKVLGIVELRPHTIIKDEAVPALLAQQRQPTFVTTNVMDFWLKVAADQRFCILCFALPDEKLPLLPGLLRRLLQLPPFKTKAARCGKVARVTKTSIQFYTSQSRQKSHLHFAKNPS